MSLSLWVDNLAAYSLQVLLLVVVAGVLPRAFRLCAPRVMLAYWQGVLMLCLLLPALQPWRAESSVSFQSDLAAASRIGKAVAVNTGGFPVYEALALVIVAGFAARLLWLALGLYRLGLHRRAARPLLRVPPAIQEMQCRIGVRPALYLSSELGSPVTFGLIHPAILFPDRFLRMEASFQRAIACHELLHVRRRDWAVNLLEELLCAVLWFHPGIWWVRRRIQLTREQVVDRQVLCLTQARKPYLEALFEIARGPGGRELAVAPSFLREPHLAIRVASILKEVSMSKTRLFFSLAAITGLVLLAGQMVARAFPLETPKQSAAAGKVYRAGKGVTVPVVLHKVEPQYSPEARDAKLEGRLLVSAEIWPDGLVHNARITKGLGMGLDEKALEALKQWKFKPGAKDGKPVKVQASIEMNFRLH